MLLEGLGCCSFLHLVLLITVRFTSSRYVEGRGFLSLAGLVNPQPVAMAVTPSKSSLLSRGRQIGRIFGYWVKSTSDFSSSREKSKVIFLKVRDSLTSQPSLETPFNLLEWLGYIAGVLVKLLNDKLDSGFSAGLPTKLSQPNLSYKEF